MTSKQQKIDITFDFRSDTPENKDPDSFSPTLRKYHKLLWSKELPSGNLFELTDNHPKAYLFHKSNLGEFKISSDTVIPSFDTYKKAIETISKISILELQNFNTLSYTIGGMMIFPGNRINGKATINGARGFHPLIKDRFDLTVECIRRYYLNQKSPLSETFILYSNFFRLFDDFNGYVQFFNLQDLVDSKSSKINFFMPFDDFNSSPVPGSQKVYYEYMKLAIEYIQARNERIHKLNLYLEV